jgi:hypothetical protein
MADLILEKLYMQPFLSWGSSSLVKADEKRKDYIRAIKIADKHDLYPLMAFAKS